MKNEVWISYSVMMKELERECKAHGVSLRFVLEKGHNAHALQLRMNEKGVLFTQMRRGTKAVPKWRSQVKGKAESVLHRAVRREGQR